MNKIISENIRTIREMKNFTRDFVAGEMEMTPSGYGKIERGETDIAISKISRLATIFGISISELLFFDVSYFFNDSREKKLENDTIYNNSEVRVLKMESDRFNHNLDIKDIKRNIF
ncbi:helix-turn-helix domain-containing protein [Flavobacterium sp. LT1R49]|uniref:helix-turn-helix domain-containing protein n=1 Tax=Flavobacterium arabinosi TaxID=3398737 RepID=UPI003A8B5A48